MPSSADGDRVVAGVGLDDRRLAEVGRGGARLGELGGELAEHEVLAAPLDEAERGDVPEHGGAAVAEHDLPPVREPNRSVSLARTPPTRFFTAGLRCDVPRIVPPAGDERPRPARRRTLDGPHPNRPSAGSRSAGCDGGGVDGGHGPQHGRSRVATADSITRSGITRGCVQRGCSTYRRESRRGTSLGAGDRCGRLAVNEPPHDSPRSPSRPPWRSTPRPRPCRRRART